LVGGRGVLRDLRCRSWISVPVALFGLLANPEAVHWPIETLSGLAATKATAFLADPMQAVALASPTQLGAGPGGGVLTALSDASGLIAKQPLLA
jgi:membrane protein